MITPKFAEGSERTMALRDRAWDDAQRAAQQARDAGQADLASAGLQVSQLGGGWTLEPAS